MAVMEKQFIIYTEYTQYRVRPNPDTPATDASEGIVLEWRDGGDDKWSNYFFDAPDAVPYLITALQALVKGDVV